MTPAARVSAAIEILDVWLGGKPVEAAILGWSRRSRFAGSKDRAAVRDLVFDAVRRKRSYAAIGAGETGRGLMIGAGRSGVFTLDDIFSGGRFAPLPVEAAESGRPPHSGAEENDLPNWLWDMFKDSLGEEAQTAAQALRERAPVFLRVNLRRVTLKQAQDALSLAQIKTQAVPDVPTALRVTDGARYLRNAPPVLDGCVELQDAASQDIVAGLPIKDGFRVLDYCAGGGGKSLAMADKWDIEPFLHDIAPERMQDVPSRAQRSRIRLRTVTQAELAHEPAFDLVLCDVPCSGSGSWRRAPDAKWSLTPERLEALTKTQLGILERTKSLVRPGGYLVYVTCSILRTENDGVVQKFLSRCSGITEVSARFWPIHEHGDGFYRSILKVE